jgi:hypothetical protein
MGNSIGKTANAAEASGNSTTRLICKLPFCSTEDRLLTEDWRRSVSQEAAQPSEAKMAAGLGFPLSTSA